MSSSGVDHPHDIPTRAPSRAGHRRPPLKRVNASCNICFDRPPNQTPSVLQPDIDASGHSNDSDINLGGGTSHSGDTAPKVDLSPICPPSPPSLISSASPSSFDLSIPIDPEEWERVHDGFPPPTLLKEFPAHSWPLTPNPNKPPPFPPRRYKLYPYHGRSQSCLSDMKRFWHRRHLVWWDYDEHCRYLQSFAGPTPPSDDETLNLEITVYYPNPPAFPLSRPERAATKARSSPHAPRRPLYPPWAPVFPRFGDLADLRDPACQALDRMFLNFPSYTISKFIYIEQMVAFEQDLRARTCASQTAAAPSPSPSALVDAPWSPGSVYSDDGGLFSPLATLPTSSASSLVPPPSCHYGPLRWLDRWELLKLRLFPPSLSPSASSGSPPRSPPEPASVLSSRLVQPPPRPGTPLPDEDEQIQAQLTANLTRAHLDEQVEVTTNGPVDVCARPVSSSPCGLFLEVDQPAHAPSSNGGADGSSESSCAHPVVRLPSSASSSRSPRTYAARLNLDVALASDGQSPPSRARTLADELSEAMDSAGVQFSVAPPSAAVQAVTPRFSFFAEESAFELDGGGPAFDVGAPAIMHMSSVPVEAVSC